MDLFQDNRWHYIGLFCVASLLYVNTLTHGFVLDDEVVIVQNSFVKQGIKGIPSIFAHDSFAGYGRVGEEREVVAGGRYRPLSLAVFAVIYSAFGANPFIYHLFVVLLYGVTCVLLYRLLLLILKDRAYHIEIAWFASLIFAVHPVHTEVVANIKGCDEQLALFFGLASFIAVFKWVELKGSRWMMLAGIFFLLACLAKENAIALLLIIPLAVLFFRVSGLKRLFRYAAPGVIATFVFLLIRFAVLNAQDPITQSADPLNDPFLKWNGDTWIPASFLESSATVLYTFGQYVRLMIFPHPLTHDYYPYHIELQNFSNPYVLISLVMLIALAAYGLFSIRRKGIAGFGILFFLIALSITANVLFPVGTFMAERFLFFPSVGFLLAIAVLLVHFRRDQKLKYVYPVIYGVVILFAVLTIHRNGAWKDNETLIRTDLSVSSNSVKLRNDFGTILLTKALQSGNEERDRLLEEAYGHLKFSVELHKTYYDAFLAYGATAFYLERYEESVKAYHRAYELYPQDPMARTGLLYALQGQGVDTGRKGNPEKAITIFTQAWQLQPDTTSALELSKYYTVLEQPGKSIEWLEKAALLVPDDAKLKFRLAKAYHDAGNMAAAAEVYRRAKELDPSLPEL